MFKKGQLVQAYCSNLMNTLSTDQKLQPAWSRPYHICEHILNLYKLEDLNDTPKPGKYNARCLRIFILREGTELARVQKEVEERIAEEEEDKTEGEPEEEWKKEVEKEDELDVSASSITGQATRMSPEEREQME